MNVTVEPKAGNWRGRGAPRKQVPSQVRKLADETYGTGYIGRAQIGSEDEEDAAELASLLRSYANSIGKRMRIQREDDVMRWEMVDRAAPTKRQGRGKGEHTGRGSRGSDTGDAA